MSTLIEQVGGWIDSAQRVVVLTGAGISTDSGIPDFRGPQGVWTRNPKAEKLSDIRYYMTDPEVRRLSWQSRLDHTAWSAKPNPGHLALVALERRGKLHALITQNIDELHQVAGNSAERVIEVHGTMRKAVCMSCGWRGPMQETLERVRAGEEDPPCLECGGILKSATILFGQALVPTVIDRAMQSATEADLLMVRDIYRTHVCAQTAADFTALCRNGFRLPDETVMEQINLAAARQGKAMPATDFLLMERQRHRMVGAAGRVVAGGAGACDDRHAQRVVEPAHAGDVDRLGVEECLAAGDRKPVRRAGVG